MGKKWSHKHDYPLVEVWNTDTYIARAITPRLRAFKAIDKRGTPQDVGDMRKWNGIIDKMIRAFELIGLDGPLTDEEEEAKKEGFNLFCKYFFDLWD